ncbi:MAG: molecular chaperone TorD family protein, partial [Thermodesulfovibrionales bacterium]|nr:molecular chaperone TorD family protein [Thermodesulfovibrionales bacterium]
MNDTILNKEPHRADIFKYLSASFYQPDKDLFQETDFFNNLKNSLSVVYPEALIYAENMERTFNLYTQEELLIDYASLFLGPFELKAPPYGSVYLEVERRLMGDTTLLVMEYYEQCGLTLDDEFKEAPDHITAELEFVYYLILREIEEIRNNNSQEALSIIESQKRFITAYLASWVGEFCERIISNAQTGYYKALSELLRFVVGNTIKECD